MYPSIGQSFRTIVCLGIQFKEQTIFSYLGLSERARISSISCISFSKDVANNNCVISSFDSTYFLVGQNLSHSFFSNSVPVSILSSNENSSISIHSWAQQQHCRCSTMLLYLKLRRIIIISRVSCYQFCYSTKIMIVLRKSAQITTLSLKPSACKYNLQVVKQFLRSRIYEIIRRVFSCYFCLIFYGLKWGKKVRQLLYQFCCPTIKVKKCSRQEASNQTISYPPVPLPVV